MKKMRILLSATSLLLCLIILLTGCSSPTGENEKTNVVGETDVSSSTSTSEDTGHQDNNLQKAALLLEKVLSPMPDVLSFSQKPLQRRI